MEPSPRLDAADPLRLRLYIAGDGPNSTAAAANLRAALEEVQGLVELEVIDVVADPERGHRDGVFATPLLVKLEPAPERRILGTLHDRRVLWNVLGLDQDPS